MRFLSEFVSYILHPIFLPFYAVVLFVWCNPYLWGLPHFSDPISNLQLAFINPISGIVLINSVFFPLVTIFLMRQLEFIDSYKVEDRRQRVLVFMTTSFFFIWTFMMLRNNYSELMSDILLGATISLFAAFIINNLFEKISLHAMGMGGLLAIVITALNITHYDLTYLFLAVIFCSGLVGTARLILKAHQTREIYTGYMLGFVCQAFAFIY